VWQGVAGCGRVWQVRAGNLKFFRIKLHLTQLK
jgi:hypothetical protein